MLVFRFYIILQSRSRADRATHVFERKARGGKLLKRKFKEVHVVGLLVNFGAWQHERFVDRSKIRRWVRRCGGILVFRETGS